MAPMNGMVTGTGLGGAGVVRRRVRHVLIRRVSHCFDTKTSHH